MVIPFLFGPLYWEAFFLQNHFNGTDVACAALDESALGIEALSELLRALRV